MSARVARADLDVAAPLAAFIEDEALTGSGLDKEYVLARTEHADPRPHTTES